MIRNALDMKFGTNQDCVVETRISRSRTRQVESVMYACMHACMQPSRAESSASSSIKGMQGRAIHLEESMLDVVGDKNEEPVKR